MVFSVLSRWQHIYMNRQCLHVFSCHMMLDGACFENKHSSDLGIPELFISKIINVILTHTFELAIA